MIFTPTVSTSGNDEVSYSPSTFLFTFKNMNPVLTASSVVLTFPDWTTNIPIILGGTQVCTGITNMNTAISCSITGNVLTLSAPFTATAVTSTAGGSALTFSFKVTNGINPYNGFAKSGFIIKTTDGILGDID
jgi:hypothetical protein